MPFIDHFHHWSFSASTSYKKIYPVQNCDRNWAFPEISGYLKNWCVFVIYYITTFSREGHFNQCIVKSTKFLSACQKGGLVWFILQNKWMTFCLLKHRIHFLGYYNSNKKSAETHMMTILIEERQPDLYVFEKSSA